jgi:uncharacterized membrane protein YkvI
MQSQGGRVKPMLVDSDLKLKLVQVLTKVFRYTLANLAAVMSVDKCGELLYPIADQMRGRSFADVGVVMYEHSGRAVLFWLVSFLILSCLLLFAIKQCLSRDSNLPFWVGGITILLCLPRYLMILSW